MHVLGDKEELPSIEDEKGFPFFFFLTENKIENFKQYMFIPTEVEFKHYHHSSIL